MGIYTRDGSDQRRICRLCVMPESPPQITLDETGLCSLCVEHRHRRGRSEDPKMLESDFTKLIARHRGKGEYDCLVMCSGGKDSTASLYYMVERYKLKPLAFMFDHGFEQDGAIENVKRAVDKLGVELLYYRSHHMHGMFRAITEGDFPAVLCHVCSIWYMDVALRMAARFRIPIIVAGWTRGQTAKSSGRNVAAVEPEYEKMGQATAEFLATFKKTDERYADFPSSMDEVLKKARKRHKSVIVSPHWFLPYDADTYVNTIQEKLGWQYPEQSYPGRSTNCALNFLSVERSMKHHGYTHYHIEMSKMIREGLMTRDEAMDLLKVDFDRNEVQKVRDVLLGS